jgi:hypothetical protein
MVTLDQIKTTYKTLAQSYLTMQSPVPIKTGRLLQSIDVIEAVGDKPDSIVLDLKTVYYGYFVNFGTRFMRARPFATQASNDAKLKDMIVEYSAEKVNAEIFASLEKRLGKYWKSK